MTQDGGHRIATAAGAMLADPASLGNAAGVGAAGLIPSENLFEPAFWAARGELVEVSRGRGSAWFVAAAPDQWALRHYRRGGLIGRVIEDRYLWTGEARVRAFAEWRLLVALTRLALPVPKPIAARYQRRGLLYRCDLITRRIPGAVPLSERLARGVVRESTWREIGATVARLHAAGVDHADLNAHNILLDEADGVSVIDFDRGRLRPMEARVARGSGAAPQSWALGNIARLRRSLDKIGREQPTARDGARAWRWFRDGYDSAARL
jgi:3-deoxy-D-manno-octulosonic acid kinase